MMKVVCRVLKLKIESHTCNSVDNNQFANTPKEGATAAVKFRKTANINVDSISILMQNTIKDMGELMKTLSEVINDVKTMMQNKYPEQVNESRPLI